MESATNLDLDYPVIYFKTIQYKNSIKIGDKTS